MILEQKIESISKEFENHIISPAMAEAYRLHCPAQGGIFSCTIVFTDAGISILGDITPEQNGSCSARGYDKKWFAGRLSPGYLAEKFLIRRWIPDLAIIELGDDGSWMREAIAEREESGEITPEKAKELIGDLADLAVFVEDGAIGDGELVDRLSDMGLECDEGPPGYGYCPREQSILVSIQRAFARLYAKDREVKNA